MLDGDNSNIDNKVVRSKRASLLQATVFSCVQAIIKQNGKYFAMFEEPISEKGILSKIQNITKKEALTPSGYIFKAREGDTFPLFESKNNKLPITSFSPSPTNAGTINSADFITIDGSGFGAESNVLS